MRKLLILGALLVGALALSAAALSSDSSKQAAGHLHPQGQASTDPEELAPLLASARIATAKFATSLRRAKRAGYRRIVTQHIPDMGWHFMNPNITAFDVTRPPILVYVKHGHKWQLVAFEWVFPQQPVPDPLPGAQYGSFPAACHYVDGTFVPEPVEANCPRRSPSSGARFSFWHPNLVTLHVWAWYPNPDGIYTGFNPFINPFNP